MIVNFDSLYYTLKRFIKCFVKLRNRIIKLNNRREELWQKRERESDREKKVEKEIRR